MPPAPRNFAFIARVRWVSVFVHPDIRTHTNTHTRSLSHRHVFLSFPFSLPLSVSLCLSPVSLLVSLSVSPLSLSLSLSLRTEYVNSPLFCSPSPPVLSPSALFLCVSVACLYPTSPSGVAHSAGSATGFVVTSTNTHVIPPIFTRFVIKWHENGTFHADHLCVHSGPASTPLDAAPPCSVEYPRCGGGSAALPPPPPPLHESQACAPSLPPSPSLPAHRMNGNFLSAIHLHRRIPLSLSHSGIKEKKNGAGSTFISRSTIMPVASLWPCLFFPYSLPVFAAHSAFVIKCIMNTGSGRQL